MKIAAQAQFETELKPLISDMDPDKLTLLALVQAKKADLILEYVHHTFPAKEPWLQGQCKQIITDGFRSRTNKEDTAEEFLKMILPGPTTRGDHGNVEQSTSTDTSANQSSAARYGQLKTNPGGNSATTYAHPEYPSLPLKTRGPPKLISIEKSSDGKKNTKRSTGSDSEENQPIIKKPQTLLRVIPAHAIQEFIRGTLEQDEKGLTMKELKTLVAKNFMEIDLAKDGAKIKKWTEDIAKEIEEANKWAVEASEEI